MEKTEALLKYEICNKSESALPVIIAAAGSSVRMQGENKQFVNLCGIPVIARTLMTFENCADISRIILVVKDNDIFTVQMLCEKYGITKVSDIVCGGNSRTQSVLKGFSRLEKDEKTVLIHDGARPLVSEKIIKSVIEKSKDYSAVTCAVKVKDTVKQINEDGTVSKTLDRSFLVAVQTPQAVKTEEYLAAVKELGDNYEFTDDVSVLEAAGKKCAVTEGSYKNIKITTKEDIKLAESYLTEEAL